MKLILAAAIYLSGMTNCFAQKKTFLFLDSGKYTSTDTIVKPKVLPFRNTFELEIDPLAYAFNGYSIHGSYNSSHFKYDIGFYGMLIPAGFDNNKNFTI